MADTGNDIYEEKDIEEQVENDEIDPQEAGFMEGYSNPNFIKCKKCGKKLKDAQGASLEDCHEELDDEGNPVLVCDCCEA